MFFSGWEPLLRIVVVGSLSYIGLIAFLRVGGKRTLAKMSAFDLVVTVAFGSLLATTLISSTVVLVEGLVAFALLIFLQVAVTWSSMRWPPLGEAVRGTPRLLAYDGRPLEAALHHERVTGEELDAALRQAGLPGLDAAYAVVLETDGNLTVIPRQADARAYGALRSVRGAPEAESRPEGR